MNFPHEELKNNIDRFKDIIIRDCKRLQDRKYLQKESVLWEIGQIEEFYPLYAYHSDNLMTIHIQKKITPAEFDAFFGDIEDILECNGYRFLGPDEHYPYYREKDIYYYVKEDGDYIKIKIQSSICEKVKTGKMVQEEITDCNFIINE